MRVNDTYKDVVFYDESIYALNSCTARIFVNGADVGPAQITTNTLGRVDVNTQVGTVVIGDEVWVELNPTFNAKQYPKFRTDTKYIELDSDGKMRVSNSEGNKIPGVSETYNVSDGNKTLPITTNEQ